MRYGCLYYCFIHCLFRPLLVCSTAFIGLSAQAQLSDTPPYSDSDISQPVGQHLLRRGKVARFPNWEYRGDVLAEFRTARGVVDPQKIPGLLSNPYHETGAALNYGDGLPSNFTGHLPVYTEGNWWPYIGPYQPQPPVGPHRDLTQDSGIYLESGHVVETLEPVLVEGSSGATVVNKTPYGILITAGSYPGNEQPGQVMTPLAAGEQAPLPIPPKEWFLQGDGITPRVPELYVSVAGLNPLDAPGWHYSSYAPDYLGGGAQPDYGTPGFAYLFSSLYDELGQGSGRYFLWAGFHKNEGYDPVVSGDPGYGVALYLADELVAVMDLYLTDVPNEAQQDLWAHPRFNPQENAQGGLSAFPAAPEGTPIRYELIPHDEAQRLLQQQGGGILRKTFLGNGNATIEEPTVPPTIPGRPDALLPPSVPTDGQPQPRPQPQPPSAPPLDLPDVPPSSVPPLGDLPDIPPVVEEPPEDKPVPPSLPPLTSPPVGNPMMIVDLGFETPNWPSSFQNSPSPAWVQQEGKTASRKTGPTQAVEGAHYVYLETSRPSEANRSDTKSVLTLADRFVVNQPQLSFQYHMKGKHIGRLAVQIKEARQPWRTVWQRNGAQGESWQSAELSLAEHRSGHQPFRLRWMATSKGGWQGDMAIDDIELWERQPNTPSISPPQVNTPQIPPNNSPNDTPEIEAPTPTLISGQFTPETGRLLFIGQDVFSIDAYVQATGQTPAGVAGYTSLENLEGIEQLASYGSGAQHLTRLVSRYPQSALSVGLYLVDQLEPLNQGRLDARLDELIDRLSALNRPILLRFGFEFDNPSYNYDPIAFQTAWRKTHQRIREKGAQDKIAMVWHSYASCTQSANEWEAWYPGDDSVEWVAVSTYTPQDCDYQTTAALATFARNHQKPMMIAEATPQGMNIAEATVQPPQDRFGQQRRLQTPEQLWDAWFRAWFAFIEANQDVIRAATYISAPWHQQALWQPENGSAFYWGDSRIQENEQMLRYWLEETQRPVWRQGRAGLFAF